MYIIRWKKRRICMLAIIVVLFIQILLSLGGSELTGAVEGGVGGVMSMGGRLFGGGSSCSPPWQRPVSHPHHLPDDNKQYFTEYDELFCFDEGVDARRAVLNDTDCRCLPGWYGITCSVPEVVYLSDMRASLVNVSLRASPRRIINAFPFNAEFEMLEARLGEIGDLVDVFVILESNYSMFGAPKPLRLLERMKRGGLLAEHWCKIVYIVLDYFPGEARQNGWLIDDLLRNHLANQSLAILRNVRDDDVYLQTDADEIPNRQSLLFLKNHNGFPSVTGFYLRNSIFGFYWLQGAQPVHIILATTVGFLINVFKLEAIKIRSAVYHINDGHYRRQTLLHDRMAFMRTNKTSWSFGSPRGPSAGWHCSYCCDAACVRTKLLSAPNSDHPRWGSKQDKVDMAYIKSRINRGLYFDDKGLFASASMDDPLYAPPFVLKNPAMFLHILELPWANYKNASWRQ